ncbi:MAG: LuxR C-terminal-related transcriptional regulator [Candidatus Nanopelagicales bacterium]
MDVALIDEHDVVRTGLQAWLAGELPHVRVVGSFAGPLDFFTWLPAGLGVDALVTEIQEDGRAPDMRSLRRLCDTGLPVIIYSHLSSDEVVLAAIEAGATCFVSKTEGKDHLIEAVSSLAENDPPYIGPRMAEALGRGKSGRRICLSEREKQVLVAWFQTESKDEVGRLLHIAPATVRTHLQRIRAKYAHVARPASTKSTLLARAIEDGIIGLSDLRANGDSASRPADQMAGVQ